jgi:hypothetical protein
VLDELTMKHDQAKAGEGSSSNPASSQTLSCRPFSRWIHDAPKEKLVLLYDTAGSQYGVMTTNLVESHNMIMG